MLESTLPKGLRFSHVYLDRGTPVQDSPRLRHRLGVFYSDVSNALWDGFNNQASRFLERELGVRVPAPSGIYSIPDFFENAELRDVLDAITLLWTIVRPRTERHAEEWRTFVERAFQEENLGYRLDQACGVHFFVDEEFERVRVAALECLQAAKYAAVQTEFEAAHATLDNHPPDTKQAVRAAFEATEVLVKLMAQDKKITRLGPSEVQKAIRPLVECALPAGTAEATASHQYLESFKNWINAVQPYRHGQDADTSAPPSLDLSVALVSSGASFIRWLVSLDQAAASQCPPS